MQNEKNSVTVKIPRGMLSNLYHTASRLDEVRDALSWLIHLFEGQDVEASPLGDFDELPEPPEGFNEMHLPDELVCTDEG